MLDEKAREWFAAQGRKGAVIRSRKFTKAQLTAIARKAWRTKRRLKRENGK